MLLHWLHGVQQWRTRRRAETITMRKLGISRGFLRAVSANCQALETGEITEEVWLQRAVTISFQYPKDSGLREYLLAEEFCQQPPTLTEP